MQPSYKQTPQNIVMGPLLEGTDGRKMSSSWGNTINLTAEPNDMYGKVMTIPDSLIIKYFTLATRVPLAQVKEYEASMKAGQNPRDLKMKLGYELVCFYHSQKAADEAQQYFIDTFKNKEIPTDIAELKPSTYDIITILVESKICASKAEARRAIEQGGVKIGEQKIETIDFAVKAGDVVQKGKRFFVKVK
jgi:tyrosyl-tRNA synthetase